MGRKPLRNLLPFQAVLQGLGPLQSPVQMDLNPLQGLWGLLRRSIPWMCYTVCLRPGGDQGLLLGRA